MKSSRVVAGACAGIVAVGMFTGCASSTTGSEAQPTESKEAGTFTKDIKLTITNKSDYDLWLETRHSKYPTSHQTLGRKGYSATTTDNSPQVILARPHTGVEDKFTAENPLVFGSASIQYSGGEKELQPGETFQWTSPTSKRTYEFARTPDANSLVNMSITVVK